MSSERYTRHLAGVAHSFIEIKKATPVCVCRIIIIAKSGIKIKTKQWPQTSFFSRIVEKKPSIMMIVRICDACFYVSLLYGDGCMSLLTETYAAA